MIPTLPFYVPLTFVLTTLATMLFLWFALRRSNAAAHTAIIVGVLGIWLGLSATLAWKGFFLSDPEALPPRPLFLLVPPTLFIIGLFVTSSGKRFVDSLPQAPLTYLHVVRIPVEIVLYWLFVHNLIPELMTFEGRNLDILSGITAPLIAFFGVQQGKIGKKAMLIWHFVCLGLLFNIVGHAILALPSPFQQLAMDQPNTGVLYFPFVWLPGLIVPAVLFSHLVSVRQLIEKG